MMPQEFNAGNDAVLTKRETADTMIAGRTKPAGALIALNHGGILYMRRLKELDKVAYVRFASVYLEFEDVSEFMTELKHLVRTRAGGPPGRK